MNPTREQVIQWANAANILQTVDPLEINQWRQELIRELEHFAASAYAAARAQALDEAAMACEREAADFGGVASGPFSTDFGKHTHNAMAAGAKNCAAAIQALKGKQ